GAFTSVVYNSTLNPGRALGIAPAGRGTSLPKLAEDLVANGLGRSATVILRNVPGLRFTESTKTLGPCTKAWASILVAASSSHPAARPTNPAASITLIFFIGMRNLQDWKGNSALIVAIPACCGNRIPQLGPP